MIDVPKRIEVPPTDVLGAFGGIDKPILKHDEVPKTFDRKKECTKIVETWFYSGLNKDTQFVPKEGVDRKQAIAAIRAHLTSWALKHEHKMDLCAYLVSEWFSEVIIPEDKDASRV